MALPKKHRFVGKLAIVKKRSLDGKLFRVVSFDGASREKHFAVVVSKKVNKSAVIRNKIRRRLQEGIRQLLPEISFGNYIIYAKKEILGQNYVIIKTELDKIFSNGAGRL